MTIIEIALSLTAAYCGAVWLWLSAVSLRRRDLYSLEQQDDIERYTFHLGLCFILAVGFLGLLLE